MSLPRDLMNLVPSHLKDMGERFKKCAEDSSYDDVDFRVKQYENKENYYDRKLNFILLAHLAENKLSDFEKTTLSAEMYNHLLYLSTEHIKLAKELKKLQENK